MPFAAPRRLLTAALLVLATLLGSAPLAARPNQGEPMDRHLLAHPGNAYTFSEFDLDSADGNRHYRIWLGRPTARPAASGYPVLYLLDGNAAVSDLQPAWLDHLGHVAQPPVLVAIGYPTDRRYDSPGRTLDYTPVAAANPVFHNRPSGGADAFLAFLLDRLEPAVATRVPLDPHQRALWGHSLGGLFTLHALFARPGAFTRAYAASPSLWWNPAALPDPATQRTRLAGQRGTLVVLQGNPERQDGVRFGAPSLDTTRLFTEHLDQPPRFTARYINLPNLRHGPMFPASLQWVVEGWR